MKTIDYYRQRRRIAIVALGGVCAQCWSTDRLEFDHIDPSTKTLNPSREWHDDGFWDEILNKCQLLCNSCHKAKSARESSVRMLAKGFTHGTIYGFMKVKCQCELCTATKLQYYEKRNARRRVETGAKSRGARGPYNLPVDHGTKRMYSRGCKCDPCRAANTAYTKALKARLRGERENAVPLKGTTERFEGANPSGATVLITGHEAHIVMDHRDKDCEECG